MENSHTDQDTMMSNLMAFVQVQINERSVASKERELSTDEILKRRSVMVMSSGGEEPVMDGGSGQHSVFAGKMLNALNKASANQTGSELFTTI